MALTKEKGRWVENGRRLTGSEILERLIETSEKIGKAKVENDPDLGKLISLEFELKYEVLSLMDPPELRSEVPF